jgi:AcrR family transcriptional regulator
MLTMTRIVKDPAERKLELIEAAESLFAKKGYEDTAVSEIVKEIKVGQGTFYHYFGSKEDILEAVAEKHMAPLVEEIRHIAKSDANPAYKLNAMLNSFLKAESSEMGLMKLLHQKGNYLLHHKEEEIIEAKVVPLMVEITVKGTEERYFNTAHPEESIVFLLTSALFLSHIFSSESEYRERMRIALEDITARVLGVNGYRFHLEI